MYFVLLWRLINLKGLVLFALRFYFGFSSLHVNDVVIIFDDRS